MSRGGGQAASLEFPNSRAADFASSSSVASPAHHKIS